MRLPVSYLIYIVPFLATSILGLPADTQLRPANGTALESSLKAFITCWDIDAEHGEISEFTCQKTLEFLLKSPHSTRITTYIARRRTFGLPPCGIILDFLPGTHPSIALSVTDIVYGAQRVLDACARFGAGGSMQFEQEMHYHLGVGENLVRKPQLTSTAHTPNVGTA